MDVFLQIHDMPPENVPTITNRVNEIYKPRLQKCPTSKWFPIRTVQKTTLEYVMRFDRVTIDTLRRELRKRLNDCNATKVRIHECHSSGRNAHFAKTLDESPYDRIIELSAPNALPVLTQPVAAAVTTSIRNLPVDGGSVSKHANTRLPPLVSFEPLAGILAAQVVDAAGRNASGDNQVHRMIVMLTVIGPSSKGIEFEARRARIRLVASIVVRSRESGDSGEKCTIVPFPPLPPVDM
jgi:hypothetical protein